MPMFTGDLPRQDHPLPKALDDGAAARLLRAAQNDTRLLVRVTVEVLLRTGLRVSEYTSLRADAVESITCGWLSLVVVVALAAQAALGAWWVDPVGSLAIVSLLVKEGREAWSGEECAYGG